MATNEWVLHFNQAVVYHLESSTSNHKPLWLNPQPIPISRSHRRPFKFEDIWRADPSCEPTVKMAWVLKSRGPPMVQVQTKILRCSEKLRKWSKTQFGNIIRQLKEKTEQLKRAEEESMMGQGHDTVISLRREVQALLVKEEKMWKQRSRTSWGSKRVIATQGIFTVEHLIANDVTLYQQCGWIRVSSVLILD